MSCSHVIATYSYARQDPSKYLSSIYKVVIVLNMHNNSFLVVTKDEYWHAY